MVIIANSMNKGFVNLSAPFPVLSITRSVARRFAHICGDLRAKGLLLPDADLSIATTAIHHNLTLVTRNVKDYQRILQLTLYR